jgi:hypothetical protein
MCSQTILIWKWHGVTPKRPEKHHQKLLDPINSFSKVAGNKINLQKSVAFLYTNNEQSQNKYRKIIPFIIASKKRKKTKNKLNKGWERPLYGKL